MKLDRNSYQVAIRVISMFIDMMFIMKSRTIDRLVRKFIYVNQSIRPNGIIHNEVHILQVIFARAEFRSMTFRENEERTRVRSIAYIFHDVYKSAVMLP